jgi:hypothetical protein
LTVKGKSTVESSSHFNLSGLLLGPLRQSPIQKWFTVIHGKTFAAMHVIELISREKTPGVHLHIGGAVNPDASQHHVIIIPLIIGPCQFYAFQSNFSSPTGSLHIPTFYGSNSEFIKKTQCKGINVC